MIVLQELMKIQQCTFIVIFEELKFVWVWFSSSNRHQNILEVNQKVRVFHLPILFLLEGKKVWQS